MAASGMVIAGGLVVGATGSGAAGTFSCSAVAVGNSVNLTWDYEGTSDSYIRQDDKFRFSVPNGVNFATIYNTGVTTVRVWENGSPIDALCTEGPVDWSKTCTVSNAGAGTTISWDQPAGLGADATYYVRKNGKYLATVSGATSYKPPTRFTADDSAVVRYWDRGTMREAVCESSESTGELDQLSTPAGFSTAGHAPDRPMTTTMSDGTIYMAGTADGRPAGTFVVLASQDGSDELVEVYRATDDSIRTTLIAANKSTDTLVLQVTAPDTFEIFYRVIQGDTVTDYPKADLDISFNFYAGYNEAVLTDEGLLIGQGGLVTDDADKYELVVFDVNTGEARLLFDGNGGDDYRPESIIVDGTDIHYTAIVRKMRSAFTMNLETERRTPLGGSWSDLARVASGVTQGPDLTPTWLEHDAGSVVNLVDEAGLNVPVYDGAIFASEVIRNDDSVFMAIQPAAIGAETQFLRFDIASGDVIDLGSHPTGWNLTDKGFVSLGFEGDNLLFVADPVPSQLLGARVFRITE